MQKIISINRAKNIINICLVLLFFKTIKKLFKREFGNKFLVMKFMIRMSGNLINGCINKRTADIIFIALSIIETSFSSRNPRNRKNLLLLNLGVFLI